MKEIIQDYVDAGTHVEVKNGKYFLTDENGKNPVNGFHTPLYTRQNTKDADKIFCVECAFKMVENALLIDDLPDKYQPVEDYIYLQELEEGHVAHCDKCGDAIPTWNGTVDDHTP